MSRPKRFVDREAMRACVRTVMAHLGMEREPQEVTDDVLVGLVDALRGYVKQEEMLNEIVGLWESRSEEAKIIALTSRRSVQATYTTQEVAAIVKWVRDVTQGTQPLDPAMKADMAITPGTGPLMSIATYNAGNRSKRVDDPVLPR